MTVAVMNALEKKEFKLDPKDVEEAFMRGSGKGGQNRNKTSTACRLTHKPTGIQVRAENERSQAQNRETAWKELTRRLSDMQNLVVLSSDSLERKAQVGSGMRGDKRRTYRERDDIVTDHISGKKVSYERIMKGELELLW